MKKILYSLLAVIAIGASFVSCGSDDEGMSYSTTAEIASAGTYVGTWQVDNNGEITTLEGTVTLAATDKTGVTNITFVTSDASINATSVANVWNSNRGFQFANQVETNGLAASFAGRISEDGTLTTAFTKETRINKKRVTVNYSFIGKKQ